MIDNKEDRDYVISFLDKLITNPNSRELFRNLWEIVNLAKDENITFGELIDESDDDIEEDVEVQNIPDKTLFEVAYSSVSHYQNSVYHDNIAGYEDNTNATFVIKLYNYSRTLRDDILEYLQNTIGDFKNKKIWDGATVKISFEYVPNHTTHEIIFTGTSKILKELKFLSNLMDFYRIFSVSGIDCGISNNAEVKSSISENSEETNIKDWRKYFKKDFSKTIGEPKHEEILTEPITEDSVKKLAFINSVLTIAKKHGLDIDKAILENSIK